MACTSIAKRDDIPKFMRGHSIAEGGSISNAKRRCAVTIHRHVPRVERHGPVAKGRSLANPLSGKSVVTNGLGAIGRA
jgi:hypothetical protein